MPLLRRGRAAAQGPGNDPRPRIAEFWAWWAAHGGEVLAALGSAGDGHDGDGAGVRSLLAPRVAAVHPELHWQLRPARAGAGPAVLTVSAGIGSDRRGLAERWLLAAPPADDRVRFASAREPDPEGVSTVVELDGYEVPLSEMVAAARVDRRSGLLDVTVHHPLVPLLRDRSRGWLAGLALGLALGEDEAERRLGAVTVAVDHPRDAFPLSGLADVAAGLRAATGADTFVLLEGADQRGRVVRAMVRRPLHRVDRPLCDTHVAIVLPYTAGTDGQPVSPGLVDDVDALERAAVSALGGEGRHVVLVGHESALARFVVHLYVDGLEHHPARPLRRLVARWPKSELHVTADPLWRDVQVLLR